MRTISVGAHISHSRKTGEAYQVREHQRLAWTDPIPCDHPERKVFSRGACRACYLRHWRLEKKEKGLV